jgi:pimeloyl-ACP methyl ester carboxylesterase
MAERRKKTVGKRVPAKTKRGKRAARRQAGRAARRSAYQLADADVERFLVSGEYRGLLEEYFGEAQYRELSELARRASLRAVRGGPRALILPGIMGSTLGRPRKLIWDDVIWIDPVDVVRGRLSKLALGSDARVRALGVILFAYLKLKLRLRAAGFDADFHPFDWRQSLDRLGDELADRMRRDGAREIHLVAHSMGGLVARAAIARDDRKLARLVMLGTPNFGSFVPVQAIRATYPTVITVAKLDLANSPQQLSEKVFKTLPGLHQMLPSPRRYSKVDLYDRATWPADAPVPLQRILDGCVPVQEKLAAADDRFHLIAGVDQDTATDLSIVDGRIEYEISRDGDGTVPLDFAELPDTKTWYVAESHGSLANNRAVGEAVIDILRSGDTDRLPRQWMRGAARARRTVAEAELAIDPFPGRSAGELGHREQRRMLEGLASPDARDEPAAPASGAAPGAAGAPPVGYQHSLKSVRVDHTDQHAIVLCLARGDITEVQARALVLGLFRGVEPAGAAGSIDPHVDGAVKEMMARRMFTGEVGEIFALPTGRHRIYAEHVFFAGLGDHGTFGPEIQQFAAENVVRTCIQTHVEDFASVLIGTGSGQSVESTIYNQLAGYVRGLEDADHERRIRRVTLCERDPETFARMKEEVLRLATTGLFGNVEVLFDEIALPEPPIVPSAGRRARVSETTRLAYLSVSEEERSGRTAVYRASLLSAGGKATILTGRREVSLRQLDAHLAKIEAASFTVDTLEKFGTALSGMVLAPGVALALREVAERDQHLVVVHDAATSRIPWETICIDGWFPAGRRGLSRRYLAENLSVAKWLEQRRMGETLEVLLVVNPTKDLPGADREAKRIAEVFPQGNSRVRLTEIRGDAATRDALLGEFQSGRYDVIHYAGHAFFDPDERARSGILCAGGQVLSGVHLAGISNLPALLFFNACESGRVRRTPREKKSRKLDVGARIDRNVGMAEAFMRGGAANYLGTYWPVGDASAASFARVFYTKLLEGAAIGEAVQAGRQRIRRSREIDWVDYIHYGAYDFRLKIPGVQGRAG